MLARPIQHLSPGLGPRPGPISPKACLWEHETPFPAHTQVECTRREVFVSGSSLQRTARAFSRPDRVISPTDIVTFVELAALRWSPAPPTSIGSCSAASPCVGMIPGPGRRGLLAAFLPVTPLRGGHARAATLVGPLVPVGRGRLGAQGRPLNERRRGPWGSWPTVNLNRGAAAKAAKEKAAAAKAAVSRSVSRKRRARCASSPKVATASQALNGSVAARRDAAWSVSHRRGGLVNW